MKPINEFAQRIVSRGPLTVAAAVVCSVLLVTGFVSAATTISTNIVTAGTLTVSGVSTLSGGLTTTTASSSAILVGTENNNTVSGIMFGSCAVQTAAISTASSTYTTCTGAGGVSQSYTVFVQATSSMPFGVVVDAASTTSTTGTIAIRLYNTRSTPAAVPSNLTAGQVYLNYWAIR